MPRPAKPAPAKEAAPAKEENKARKPRKKMSPVQKEKLAAYRGMLETAKPAEAKMLEALIAVVKLNK